MLVAHDEMYERGDRFALYANALAVSTRWMDSIYGLLCPCSADDEMAREVSSVVDNRITRGIAAWRMYLGRSCDRGDQSPMDREVAEPSEMQ